MKQLGKQKKTAQPKLIETVAPPTPQGKDWVVATVKVAALRLPPARVGCGEPVPPGGSAAAKMLGDQKPEALLKLMQPAQAASMEASGVLLANAIGRANGVVPQFLADLLRPLLIDADRPLPDRE